MYPRGVNLRDRNKNKMPRERGPEHKHFGGADGLITETVHGVPKYYWRCNFCKGTIGGKIFPNAKARIHLSGDKSLRNGMIATVCPRAPDEIKEQFVGIIKHKEAQKNSNCRNVNARKSSDAATVCRLLPSRQGWASANITAWVTKTSTKPGGAHSLDLISLGIK